MNEPKPIEPPDGPWMRRLREGVKVWLVKEREYAIVNFPWQPPEPGHCSGRLVLQRVVKLPDDQWTVGRTEVWFVGSRGEGFDGKPLIQLCEGYLPEEFAEVVCEEMTNLMATLEAVKCRLEAMKYKIGTLDKKVKRLEQAQGFFYNLPNN